MRVTISPRAEKQLKHASKVDQISIARKIRELGVGKREAQEEKLSGVRQIYRVRIGSFRIVYRKTQKDLYIILIGHRKDIYRMLKHFFS